MAKNTKNARNDDILDEFEEIGGGDFARAWRPNAQDPNKRDAETTLTGVFVRYEEHQFDFEDTPSKLLILDTGDEERSLRVSGTVLTDKIAKANLRVGDKVRVSYLGEETGKTGRKYANWSVAVKRATGDVPFN